MHCTVTHRSVSQGTGYALWQDCSGEEGRREDEWIAYNKHQAEKQERDLAKGVIDLGSSARGPEEHMACDDESGGGDHFIMPVFGLVKLSEQSAKFFTFFAHVLRQQ